MINARVSINDRAVQRVNRAFPSAMAAVLLANREAAGKRIDPTPMLAQGNRESSMISYGTADTTFNREVPAKKSVPNGTLFPKICSADCHSGMTVLVPHYQQRYQCRDCPVAFWSELQRKKRQ